MREEENGRSVPWKWISFTLSGILCTLIGSYISQAISTTSRSEILYLIRSHAPYVDEKDGIMKRFDRIEAEAMRMRDNQDSVIKRQAVALRDILVLQQEVRDLRIKHKQCETEVLELRRQILILQGRTVISDNCSFKK